MIIRYNSLTLSGGQTMEVAQYIVYPQFIQYLCDIGLIQTKEKMKLGQPNADKIELPPQDFDPKPETYLNITGWGITKYDSTAVEYSENLQIAVVPVVDRTECKKIYYDLVNMYTFCAGYYGRRIDACAGDAGGPAVYQRTLYGVISWGKACANYIPAVYTNVGYFVEWIKNFMANHEIP